MGENTCKSYNDKYLVSTIYNELLQLNNTKTTQIRNGHKTSKNNSSKSVYKCPCMKDDQHYQLLGKWKSKLP